MSQIAWDDALLLGVEDVDNQHKQLVKIANSLLDAISSDQGKEALGKAVSWFREYTVFHFNAEEEFMESVGYPKRGEHAQQHMELKEKVKTLQQMLYRKENIAVSEVKQLLYEWLVGHILDSDMDIARYLNEKEFEQSASDQSNPDQIRVVHKK